jgi:hypothetical protein
MCGYSICVNDGGRDEVAGTTRKPEHRGPAQARRRDGRDRRDELGILGDANRVRAQVGAEESNAISVRLELRADCYAGIWAREAAAILGSVEPGDLDEALNAARQIGDDTLQRNAGRVPMPHTFTHGTSAQRQRWFARGHDTGDMRACDTFGTDRL